MAPIIALTLAGTALSAITASRINNKPDSWLSSDEGIKQIDNIISWQTPTGGWAKYYDATKPHQPGELYGTWGGVSTIDNNFTTTELALLAHAYTLTHRPEMLDSFNRGLDALIKAQYPIGGWPQRFPPPDNYGKQITFNDNAMVNVMRLLRDVAAGQNDYAFVDADRRARAKQAFDRGIDCILKLQIVVNGTPTAWAQQYDPQTLQPAAARSYELPGISGSESAAIVTLLMSLDNPSPQVQHAIRTAAAWFERSKITGEKIVKTPDDVIVVDDPSAPPLWARYYDIETNRPFYCGRDGVKKWSMDQIELERRKGYAWLRPWGNIVLQHYAKWEKEHPQQQSSSLPVSCWALPMLGLLAAADSQPATLSVAADGSGSFTTVQAAVDAVPENNTSRVVIQIKPGTYRQRVTVPASKPFITFQGDDAATTVLTYDMNVNDLGADGKPVGTFGSYSNRVAGHDFVAENITFENTSGDHGQALALAATGDRLIFRKCRLLGWQDTLYANGGRQYYADCYIAGRVDFIFGNATAVFDGCEIHSRNGGHITAASTPEDHPFGFVFLNCKLTGDDVAWTPGAGSPTTLPARKPNKMADLGRPWRPYAAVAYINCEMGDHIKPEGWNNWRNPANEKTARFSEYESSGPGANPEKRFGWTKQLTDDQAANYTVKNILACDDHWNPLQGD